MGGILVIGVLALLAFAIYAAVKNKGEEPRVTEEEELPPLNLSPIPNVPEPHVWSPSDYSDGEWRKLLTEGVHDAVDEDTGEMVTIHPQNASDHVEGLLVSFGYRDASDNPSRRMLLCARCWEDFNALYVRGYCTLRHALRTFRPDRMTGLKEMRSGNSIADPITYFAQFVAAVKVEDDAARQAEKEKRWAEAAKERESRQALAQVAQEAKAARKQAEYEARDACVSGLRILAYIALCDGVVADKEREVQSAFITARLIGVGKKPDSPMVEAMLSIARGLAVPERSFAAAINKIKAEGYLPLMLDYAERLAIADGRTTEKELSALEKLRKAIN
jgi:hypothetical protein